MKLSELKSIIMECIDELNEGPARNFKNKHGFKISSVEHDLLMSRKYNKPKAEKLKHSIKGHMEYIKRPNSRFFVNASSTKRNKADNYRDVDMKQRELRHGDSYRKDDFRRYKGSYKYIDNMHNILKNKKRGRIETE